MDLSQLGNIGEFVGAIAVVGSLIYLSVQIRQNTRSMRASTYAECIRGWQDYLFGQSVEDLDLLLRASSEHEELSNPEFMRVFYLARVQFRRMENDYYQVLAGNFDRATWDAYVVGFREETFASRANQVLWELQKDRFTGDFVRFMDENVVGGPSETPHLRRDFRALMRK